MKDYYAYRSMVRNKESYCLLPLSENTPFIDGMLYGNEGFLLLLTRAVKERFQMVPKIDDFGAPVLEKSPARREKLDRIRMDTNYEHYISDPADVRWFAENFIENSKDFLEFFENCSKDSDESKSSDSAGEKQKEEQLEKEQI